MIIKDQYIKYLLSIPINYTCSNLSEHLENVSHNSVSDFFTELEVNAKRYNY